MNISNYPTLPNYLFGAVSLTKNADIDKYKYPEYRIVFDRHQSFSFHEIGLGRNVIVSRVDMSSTVHFDYKKNYILILGKDPLEHTLTAGKMHSINFTEDNKHFVWVYIIMEQTVIYL